MAAAVCGGKRSFFEDIPSSPPLSKRPRCASPTSLPNFASSQPVLDRLRFVFPHINPQILERALEECNNDLDSVIKKLNELCSGPAEEKSASVEELGIINEILSRNHIPVIVGVTNYYIQALVSPFLLDDSAEDMDESCPSDLLGDEQTDLEPDFGSDSAYSYEKEFIKITTEKLVNTLVCMLDLVFSIANFIKERQQRTGVVWTILDSIAALHVLMQLPQCWTNMWNKE